MTNRVDLGATVALLQRVAREDQSPGEAGIGPQRVEVSATPLVAETSPLALEQAITPPGSHFVRNHLSIPRRSEQDLALDGGSIGLAVLKQLGRRTQAATIECAGNHRLGMTPLPPGEPWGSGGVGTAVWTGVPLRALLERVGVRDDAVEILAEGADGYARSLPMEDAFDPSTLLAFEMNGRPLPIEHGAPLRLVVPGWYGMASVKWLARLRVLTVPYLGFYQKQRYVYDDQTPVKHMRVNSRIARPRADELVACGRRSVWGWAWSGLEHVSRVDVSLDGSSWIPATLGRALSPYAWRPWQVSLDIARPGRHTLRARAADARGNVQPDRPPWNPLGYGNNAVSVRCFLARP